MRLIRTLIPQPDGTFLVPLNHGLFSRIDAVDAPFIGLYTWHANRSGPRPPYARTGTGPRGPERFLYMHRLVVSCPPDKVVDHLNFDTLDNRRENLRICEGWENSSRKQNAQFHGGSPGVTYKHDGQRVRRWLARYKRKYVGYFQTQTEAAAAVQAAMEHDYSSQPATFGGLRK